MHNDTKILCFRVIYGKIGDFFNLTTLITTSLRLFRVWQVPQEYVNIQIYRESGSTPFKCIAVNVRLWMEIFFPHTQASHLSDTRITPQNSAGLYKVSEQMGSDCRVAV